MRRSVDSDGTRSKRQMDFPTFDIKSNNDDTGRVMQLLFKRWAHEKRSLMSGLPSLVRDVVGATNTMPSCHVLSYYMTESMRAEACVMLARNQYFLHRIVTTCLFRFKQAHFHVKSIGHA